jgi:hypothetical protein
MTQKFALSMSNVSALGPLVQATWLKIRLSDLQPVVGSHRHRHGDPLVVPFSGRGVEDGEGGVGVPLGGQPGSLPDFADGARAEADDPAGGQVLEGLEGLWVEVIAGHLYRRGEEGIS